MMVTENLASRGAGLTPACCPCGELVDLSPVPTACRLSSFPPPKADLWVSDELGHSTSTVTFPLHHGEDAARGPGTLGVLQLGEDDVVC